jgi:hypothetical protein
MIGGGSTYRMCRIYPDFLTILFRHSHMVLA